MIGASLNEPALSPAELGRRMAPLFAGDLHALVVGGTTGIGHAVSTAFAAAGVAVTATGISETEINSAPFEAGLEPKRAILNVTDQASIDAVAAALERLDIVVNCAGASMARRAEFDPVNFQKMTDINLTGALRLANAARQKMAGKGGAIVNFCSFYSQFGSAYLPAYAASKGGLLLLTKSLAAAWVKEGIRVNAVAPGVIATPMTTPLMKNEAATRELTSRVPIDRVGQPADVAGSVLFLCSPAAAYVTGVLLPVDGGMVAA
jgi:NAD(P)-dependent dehydrogenase (short-subunit alcohol dehydrogenase family)